MIAIGFPLTESTRFLLIDDVSERNMLSALQKSLQNLEVAIEMISVFSLWTGP